MEQKTGGLYKNVKMSVKSANILVAVSAMALILVIIIAVSNNGFTVKFDTMGGTRIETVKLMYGDKIPEELPTKEGQTFTGWYLDEGCTNLWNMDDPVTESMTLYAGWN